MDRATHKRIEILTDAPLVPAIVAACRSAGIVGHSVVPMLSGHGRGGSWSAD